MTSTMQEFSDRQVAREEILARVARGEISPAAGEDEAQRIGCAPLLPKPRDEDYDPLQQDRWSLLMAWSWVAFRAVPPVRSADNSFYTRQFRWEPATRTAALRPDSSPVPLPPPLPLPLRAPILGYRMVPNSPRWLNEVHLNAWDDQFAFFENASTLRAYRELVFAMATGKVASYARDLRDGRNGDVALIPPNNWYALHLGARSDPAGDMLHFGDKAPAYVDVLIDQGELRAAFPARPLSDAQVEQVEQADVMLNASGRTPESRRQERECVDWLVEEYMSKCDERTDTQDDLWPMAHAAWPSLSKRNFEQAWKTAIEEANAPKWADGGVARPGLSKLDRQGPPPQPPLRSAAQNDTAPDGGPGAHTLGAESPHL